MKKINFDQGQLLILATVVIGLILINILVITSGATLFHQSSQRSLEVLQATNLAEAGVDKAIALLNLNSSYSGDGETALGSGSFDVSVSNLGNNKIIHAVGYIPSKFLARVTKRVQVEVSLSGGGSRYTIVKGTYQLQ